MRRHFLLLLLSALLTVVLGQQQLLLCEADAPLVSTAGGAGALCAQQGQCTLSWALNISGSTLLAASCVTDLGVQLLASGAGTVRCAVIAGGAVTVSVDAGGLSWRLRFAAGNCSAPTQPTTYSFFGTLSDGTSITAYVGSNAAATLPCSRAATSSCGNGVRDPGEQCDGTPCCTEQCTWAAPGTACSDGDACTTSDSCIGSGYCVGVPVVCDDGVACTLDTCVAGQCLYTWQTQQKGCRRQPTTTTTSGGINAEALQCSANCSGSALRSFCAGTVGTRSTGSCNWASSANPYFGTAIAFIVLFAVENALLLAWLIWAFCWPWWLRTDFSSKFMLWQRVPTSEPQQVLYQAPLAAPVSGASSSPAPAAAPTTPVAAAVAPPPSRPADPGWDELMMRATLSYQHHAASQAAKEAARQEAMTSHTWSSPGALPSTPYTPPSAYVAEPPHVSAAVAAPPTAQPPPQPSWSPFVPAAAPPPPSMYPQRAAPTLPDPASFLAPPGRPLQTPCFGDEQAL